MKVGDLVTWSDLMIAWHARSNYLPPDLVDFRQHGIIYGEDRKHYFVLWGDGDCLAELPENLEVISESR